jgi:uncharacterized SAM-binding protein YcdF (DUF218 family)
VSLARRRVLVRGVVALVVLTSVCLVGWAARARILRAAGAALISEDPISPGDVIVLTNNNSEACALEAAALYRESVARRIVLGVCTDCAPLKGRILELGIPYLDPPTLARLILEKSGIPPAAITVLPGRVDGTEAAVDAISRFVQQHGVQPIVVVTARSHTARTRWLLRRSVPRGTVLVRSSRFDEFSTADWWHDRNQSREVVMEYIRWMHVLRLPFQEWIS